MFAKRGTLRTSAATTTATTETGDWFEVDECHELYVWLDVTAFASRSDETLIVTIEREALNTNGYTTILTFNTVNTTGAQSQEQLAFLFLGGRIRAKCVTAGTWSSKSITYSVKCYAKV